MPKGDGTGPLGAGPMSGRVMGFCAGSQNPGTMGYGFAGRCYGGHGRGFRNRFTATGRPFCQSLDTPSFAEPADQKTWLKNRADALASELNQIHEHLNKLEDDNK